MYQWGQIFAFLLLLYSKVLEISGHTYHLGGNCAEIEPMPGFTMDKFLGKWFAVQKTSTSSRCVIYDFHKTEFRRLYKVEQLSENSVLGLVKSNNYRYTGNLEYDDDVNQANMHVKFPLNVAGESSFIVFMTDYDNYAGIYTCQKLGFTHRHSATILSRNPSLEKSYTEKIRNRLATFNVNPFDLTNVNQTGCVISPDALDINIDDSTFSKENIKNTLKDVGSKVMDGVDFLVKGAKKVYHTVKNEKPDEKRDYPNKDREEVTESHGNVFFEPNAELL